MDFPPLKKTFLQLLGPSFLFVALSISGGEMLLWPELISRYGLLILWIVPLILFFQYSVNIEIERYTLVTGKNTLTRLASISSIVGWLVIISVVISLLWPAWITTSASMIAFITGSSQYATLISIVILGLLLLLWNNKNSYTIMELGAKIGMALVLSISFGIVIYLLGIKHLPLELGTQWVPDESDSFSYVAALAFGGVTGVLNLVQSDWIASRNYGATSLKNPQEIKFDSKHSLENWRNWWSIVTKEHFWLFYIGNVVGIGLIGLVAALTLKDFDGTGFALLNHQVDYLNSITFGLGLAWGVGVILLFSMAQITILDAAGKLIKRVDFGFTANYSAAQLSQFTGILGIGVLLIGLINPSFSQPGFLLKISAVLSAGVMSIYPIALIRINSALPVATRPNLIAKLGTTLCSLFYGGIVIWMIVTMF